MGRCVRGEVSLFKNNIEICRTTTDKTWIMRNVVLFGFTAKAWREVNPELAQKSNVRDFATMNELTVLSNLETHNDRMMREGKNKEERFGVLKEIAEYQLNILNTAEHIKMIETCGDEFTSTLSIL